MDIKEVNSMKSFFEKAKDILYDGIDYIMMIIIIVVVALVINWRLDGLFATNAEELANEPPINMSNIDFVPEDFEHEDKPDDNKDSNKTQDENIDETIKIDIPADSLPSDIGNILASNGLINSKKEFVQKAMELNLDTKLKSGKFEIAKSSSLEEIINTLTK